MALNRAFSYIRSLVRIAGKNGTDPASDTNPVPVEVSNQLTDYPLPSDQVATLTPQKDALTNEQLRASPLPLPVGAATEAKQLPDNHQVQVSNFPETQNISLRGMNDTTTVTSANPFPVFDDYYSAEYLEDQTATSPSVLTFTFTEPVQLVWVYMKAATVTDEGRITVGVDNTGGGTATPVPGVTDPVVQNPTNNLGTVLQDQTPTPITVFAKTVKVFAPTGARVTVYGYRR